MRKTVVIEISPDDLSKMIGQSTKNALVNFFSQLKAKKIDDFDKPHLTKKETAEFFSVTPNCITDWCNNGTLSKKRIGQRVYFLKSDLIRLLLDQEESIKD